MNDWLAHPASLPTAFGLLGATLFVWRSYLLVGQGRKALEQKRQEHESLFSRNVDGVIAVNPEGLIDRVNPAVGTLTGRSERDLIGRPFLELLTPAGRGLALRAFERALAGEQNTVDTEVPKPRGELADIELTSIPIVVAGDVVGTYEILRDTTDRKKLQRELQNRALHDYLTGLPNRALFADRLQHALTRAQRSGQHVALLYVDLDRFKPINDRAGHAVGDELLREVSSRLGSLVRDADTVARVGGDEFAVLLETVESEAKAITAAERIVALIRAPVVVDGEEHQVGASVGVAVSSAETENPQQLVHQADLAMYDAKRRGGFQYRVYSHELEQSDSDWSVRLESDLRRAIERGELSLQYQPIVDTNASEVVGVEALVRWDHPEHGPLLPTTFIPVAEASSLISELDRWVLEQGCREIQRLVDYGVVTGPFFLSINLSARHFDEDDFVAAVSDIMTRTAYDPERLQLEITESSAGGDPAKVRALKTLGVKVAIDDFGTGFSSLSYLRELAVDVLKVDRSFVLSMGVDPASVAIVRTILTLAEMLDLEVIVEGIENLNQLGHFEDLGGGLVQGYLYGRPLGSSELPGLITGGVPDPRRGRKSGTPATGDPAAPPAAPPPPEPSAHAPPSRRKWVS